MFLISAIVSLIRGILWAVVGVITTILKLASTILIGLIQFVLILLFIGGIYVGAKEDLGVGAIIVVSSILFFKLSLKLGWLYSMDTTPPSTEQQQMHAAAKHQESIRQLQEQQQKHMREISQRNLNQFLGRR